MKELIKKLTKKELIEVVKILAENTTFKLRKSDLAWAKWLTECKRNIQLNAQRKEIKDIASEDYKQIQKKIDASHDREDKLFAQYEVQRKKERWQLQKGDNRE